MPEQRTPIVLPAWGDCRERAGVSQWLVELHDRVSRGERVVELLVSGVTFDLEAPCDGRLSLPLAHHAEPLLPGQVVGWIESDAQPPADPDVGEAPSSVETSP